MIAKALLAALAAASLIAANQTDIIPADRPEVVQVMCERTRGTAFYIGPTTLLSVAHVTSNKGCTIKGKPVKVLGQKGDFSMLQGEPSDRWLTVDCGGFQKGRKYIGTGYARGLYTLTTVDLLAMGEDLWGLYRLWAVFTVVPGMSGGPIADSETGKVAGTINTYNAVRGDSGSVELKRTSVCNA